MSDTSSQNVNQSIGTNQGNVQGVAAGRDTYVTQNNTQRASEQVGKEEALELLNQIEVLLRDANLPVKLQENTLAYVEAAKKETQKEEPRKQIVKGNLEGVLELLKNASGTVDAAKDLIGKLKEPIIKIAYWVGMVVAHFFT